MDDRIDSGQGLPEVVFFADISLDELETLMVEQIDQGFAAKPEVIHHPHMIVLLQKQANQAAANVASSSGDQYTLR
jgi:hypothetical protein